MTLQRSTSEKQSPLEHLNEALSIAPSQREHHLCCTHSSDWSAHAKANLLQVQMNEGHQHDLCVFSSCSVIGRFSFLMNLISKPNHLGFSGSHLGSKYLCAGFKAEQSGTAFETTLAMPTMAGTLQLLQLRQNSYQNLNGRVLPNKGSQCRADFLSHPKVRLTRYVVSDAR
jgi:hypothetical protein